MTKNNKGFMLIEVIVVSTIVLTSMITLYVSFNKLYNNYKIKNSYYNIDATYATKKTIDSMIREERLNNLTNKIKTDSFFYYYLIKENQCIELEDKYLPFNCGKTTNFYNVNNMIFVNYNLESLNKLIEKETLNETFKDYIAYLIKYYNITDNEEYNYIVITEVKQNNEYYYASLRVR